MDLPMSGDEVWVAVVSTALTGYFWISWYWSTSTIWPDRWRPAGRGLLWAAPILTALLILAVLTTVASHDVVNDPRYIYMYLLLGMAWVGGAVRGFATAGLNLRYDAVELRNPAVAPAATGAALGVAAAYAGGNIGDGPGWWVVVFCALIATIAFFICWHLLEAFTGTADSITVHRDEAAGWRLGGFLLAAGLILGRAVAGDWVSGAATVRDAVVAGWPVVLLLGLAVGLDRMLRASDAEPHPPVASSGWMPALAMVGLAAAYLTWLGVPV